MDIYIYIAIYNRIRMGYPSMVLCIFYLYSVFFVAEKIIAVISPVIWGIPTSVIWDTMASRGYMASRERLIDGCLELENTSVAPT